MARSRPSAKLILREVAHKRFAYTERTRQNSRVAKSMLATVNGHGQHWSHDDIRTALLRRHAVEIDELLDELPRPAINHAVAKGWIHKTAGEVWFRVTKRAAAELQLPARHNRRKIQFIDAGKLPKSLPAFDDPKPALKPVVSGERAKTMLAALVEPRDVLAQARLYQATLAETGWAAVELARRLHSDPAAIARRWDDIIYHIDLLALEDQYQSAVANGQLSLADAYQLFRVAPTHRAELFIAFRAGKSRSAVRKLAGRLLKSSNLDAE